VLRIVADLGNTRLKWGRLDSSGRVAESFALEVDDKAAWRSVWDAWGLFGEAGTAWAVSSVNPRAAERLERILEELRPARVSWFRSAAEVPVRHALQRPETAGADRALAVAAAACRAEAGRPGMVVLCGTALTVERVAADGTWQGGAIAAGLSLTARALHAMTEQLPLVRPRQAPPAWGDATVPALEAGVFWGAVGAVRELLTRQSAALGGDPCVVWTGGDAEVLAPAVAWPGARVVPDLVLHGLAAVGFEGGEAAT
jgi:type III pantothenate kinase